MLGGGLDGGPWVTLRLPTAISLGYASAFVLSEHAAVRNPLDNGSADFYGGYRENSWPEVAQWSKFCFAGGFGNYLLQNLCDAL